MTQQLLRFLSPVVRPPPLDQPLRVREAGGEVSGSSRSAGRFLVGFRGDLPQDGVDEGNEFVAAFCSCQIDGALDGCVRRHAVEV